MNWQSFISLIQNKSDSTFFLSSTRQERTIGQILCGLLNTAGGQLIIGYDKVNVHLTGYEQTDQWIDQFLDDHFKNAIISSTFLFRSNKKILILDIEKSQMELTFSGKYYKLHEGKIVEYTPIIQQAIQSNIPQQIPNQIITQSMPQQLTNEKSFEYEKSTSTTFSQNQVEQGVENVNTENLNQNKTSDILTNNLEKEEPYSFNTRQMKAIDFITKQGSIKNKQYRKLFSVSHKTAHIELAELVQQNKLMIVGSGRSTCYRLPSSTNNIKKVSSISVKEAVIPRSLIDSFLASNSQITESMYADEFNMDLAQAINELQFYCEEGFLEKTLINNDVCYVKAKQLSFI